ncbi:MAG: DUF6033 family protein [Oscillospiraceae bacterium]|nr:DUF6033 family protein [Oscillospiraceae bacterium]
MSVNSLNSVFSNFAKSTFKSQAGAKPQPASKPQETFSVQKAENTEKIEKSGLSEKAQAYLSNLQEKFGNINFVIGDFSDKDTANYKGGGKEYNCFISADLLERMAADESVAEKYEGIISDSVLKVDELKQTIEDKGLAKYIKSYGVKVNNDGTVDYILTLSDSLKGMYEKKAAEKSENKKIDKGYKSGDSPKTLTAGSIEELLAKLEEIISAKKELLIEKTANGNDRDKTAETKSDIFEEIIYMNNHNHSKHDFSYVRGRRDGFVS